MANGILDGFGGLVKGLADIMPQDDPDIQLFKAQNEVKELTDKEEALYGEIGKEAVEQYGLDAFGELAGRLKLVQDSRAAAQVKLTELQEEKAAREQAEQESLESRTCPRCGTENPEGTKFCQECGTILDGTQQNLCPSCGTSNPMGTNFCKECGAKLQTQLEATTCPACGAEVPPGTRFCGECGGRIG